MLEDEVGDETMAVFVPELRTRKIQIGTRASSRHFDDRYAPGLRETFEELPLFWWPVIDHEYECRPIILRAAVESARHDLPGEMHAGPILDVGSIFRC